MFGTEWTVGEPNFRGGTPTNARTIALIAAASIATVGLAAVSWVVAIHEMNGMNMGVESGLGSLGLFLVLWVWMMAAMMLPGALPAVVRSTLASRRMLSVPLFVASYLAVWTVAGLAVYALYRPHPTVAAGAVTIAAGIYELTPPKRHFRRRCHEAVSSGLGFGFYCVGSSIGLMAMLVALGVMSIIWMVAVAVLIVGQKLLPAKSAIDVPLALAIIGFGILIVIAPSSVPGLIPPM